MLKDTFRFLSLLAVLFLMAPMGLAADRIAGWSPERASQPQCLGPVGVWELHDSQPDFDGSTVNVALVELSQPSEEDPTAYAFLPDFEHWALMGADWRGLYCYQNPHRPVQKSEHASRIAGILFGYDTLASYKELGLFEYRGIVPEAVVDVFETNWFIYKRVLAGKRESFDNDVISMSWGTDADDEITLWWQRGIDAMAEGEELVAVTADGNGPKEFASICKPSWGYNVISVAAARSLGEFPRSLQYVGPPTVKYSSCGPTDDGRCKPDLIAPGLCLGPGGHSNDAYICGRDATGYSSFAAPQVAGIAALLIDAARQLKIDQADDPRVIKALLLNGAVKLVGWHKGTSDPEDDYAVPLDYRQGAGLVNAWNSYRHLTGGRYNSVPINHDPNSSDYADIGWDLDQVSLDPNDPNSVKIYYLPEPLEADEYFTGTLCWFRHYRQEGIFSALPLNVLTMELWSIDNQGQFLERLDYSYSESDNLQHIYYHSPRRQKIAFMVSVTDDPVENTLSDNTNNLRETYGLAYSCEKKSWQGDQFSGDLNVDGIVDVQDLLQLIKAWWSFKNDSGSTEMLDLPEDINCDGLIDRCDFDEMAEQWQKRSAWRYL